MDSVAELDIFGCGGFGDLSGSTVADAWGAGFGETGLSPG